MFSRRSLLSGLLSTLVVSRAFAQETVRLRPGALDSAQQNAPNALMEPYQARTMATRAVDAVTQICNAFSIANKRLTAMETTIKDAKQKIRDLEAEKENALAELRAGAFCSKCGRSKTEIERAEPVSFSEHIRDVQGRVLAATPEQLAAKAKEYDVQLAPMRQQQAKREENFERTKERQQDYIHQIDEGVKFWRLAIYTEKWLIQKQGEILERALEREQKTAQSNLDRIEKEIGALTGSDPNVKAKHTNLLADKQLWEQVLDDKKKGVSGLFRAVTQKIAQSDNQADRDYKILRDGLAKTVDDNAFAAVTINASISIPTPVGRLSTLLSPHLIRINFKMTEVLSIGLEARFDRSERSMEVSTFFEAIEQQVGIAFRSEETAKGLSSGFTPVAREKEAAPNGVRNIDIPSLPKKLVIP